MEGGEDTKTADNIINVSTQKNFTFFVFLAKKFLEENEENTPTLPCIFNEIFYFIKYIRGVLSKLSYMH
jgi:hypothetical protein